MDASLEISMLSSDSIKIYSYSILRFKKISRSTLPWIFAALDFEEPSMEEILMGAKKITTC